MKKKKRVVKKGFRYLLITIVFMCVSSFFIYNIFNVLTQINEKLVEEKKLKSDISNLKQTEKDLNDSIIKLKDPDYAARYAREKYLYSKDGEKVIKIK